ncbi:hypothetical protein ACQEUU_00720 [Nonomuraea sp. CA-218870]|uniref:hypothetical protein n=1 Tax=Nonomuraea sp. CA-218870 TaxID=3239998 RepID=UPI003D8A6A9D
MSSRISVPSLSALAILTPLAPAVIVPKPANVVAGAVISALLVAPVVALRRKRGASWVGAALLALLAMTAAVQPVFGFGNPSAEEIRRQVEIQIALGRPIDLHGGALRFLPWDANDLLLLAVAALTTAVLAAHAPSRRPHRAGGTGAPGLDKRLTSFRPLCGNEHDGVPPWIQDERKLTSTSPASQRKEARFRTSRPISPDPC